MEIDLSKIDKLTALIISTEECGELIQAITKNIRGKGDYDNTCEEIADVMICIDWIINKLELDPGDIESWKKYKTDKINKRIRNGEFG